MHQAQTLFTSLKEKIIGKVLCKNSQGSLCCVLIYLMCSARGTADLESEMSWYTRVNKNPSA